MAAPDAAQPPESLMLNQFSGIKNTVSAERLGPGDLQRATNVDLDDIGQPRRRRGYTLKLSGDCHSLYAGVHGMYVVKDGVLGQLSTTYTFTALQAGVGSDPLAYADVVDDTYFVSRVTSGVIRQSGIVDSWGAQASATTWHSPVITPSDTLNPVAGKLLAPPPLGTALAHHKGRLYIANDSMLWATELYLYEWVDRTKNFIPFEADITFVINVSDGLYVGTDAGVYFLGGEFGQGMPRVRVSTSRGLPGSAVRIPSGSVVGKETVSRDAVLFMTDEGLSVGFDGGMVKVLTDDKAWLPNAQHVTGLLREQDGFTQYVGVADSGGSPASNTRIGDYVDAEIRRAI